MIIAIAGVKQSGKYTAAMYLATSFKVPIEGNEKGFARSPFLTPYRLADPLKKALEDIYGWDHLTWNSPNEEKEDPYWGISPHLAAQLLKIEWPMLLADRSPEYATTTGYKTYVKSLLRYAERYPGKNFVIPDVQSQYEIHALQEFGLKMNTPIYPVQIRRPEVEATIDSHSSEQEILTLDIETVILNDGTLENLYSILDEFAQLIGLTSNRG
jgi:hypothetical protein